jgi:hypothetical protein
MLMPCLVAVSYINFGDLSPTVVQHIDRIVQRSVLFDGGSRTVTSSLVLHLNRNQRACDELHRYQNLFPSTSSTTWCRLYERLDPRTDPSRSRVFQTYANPR